MKKNTRTWKDTPLINKIAFIVFTIVIVLAVVVQID